MTRTDCTRTPIPNPLLSLGWLFLLLGMLLSFSVQAEPAGRLLFARGEVQVVREGEPPRMVVRGDVIEVGDTIRTSEGASAQLRLTDGAMVALRSDTTYQIDEQKYDREKPEESSQAAKLLRGGLRAITGAIGKERPAAVKLSTPVATIGIRGTVYDTIYVPPEGLPGLPDVPPGHYTLVLDGEINVSNPAGELTVGVGEIAYVADAGTPPQLRPDLSWLFERYVTLQQDDDGGDDDGIVIQTGDIDEVLTDTAVGEESEPQSTVKAGPYALAVLAEGFTVYEGSFVTNVASVGGGGELIYADAGSFGLIDTFDANGNAINTGSTTAGDSTINWGEYNYMDAFLYDSSGNPLVYASNVQYIDATQVLVNVEDLPTSGSFTYNYVGGAGVSLDPSSSLVVDFGAATMSVNLDWSSFGDSWTASNQSIADFYANGISLSSTSYGPGSINGRFVGADADGAMTAFDLDISDGVASGVAAFAR